MFAIIRKISFCLIVQLLSVGLLPAQQAVKLEELRCYSAVGPMLRYFQDPALQQSMAKELQQILYHERGWRLTDSISLPVTYPNLEELKKNKSLLVKDTKNQSLHLWMDWIEVQPINFFAAADYLNDSVRAAQSASVVRIAYYLLNPRNELIEKNEIDISLTQSESPSIGIPFKGMLADGLPYLLTTTARGFREAMIESLKMLFKKDSTTSFIEVRVPPAYFFNNFIEQSPHNKHLIIRPEVKNKSLRFLTDRGTQIIRNGETEVRGVRVGGKKQPGFPEWVFDSLRLIKRVVETDFICLQHVMRDVLNDKSYEVKFFGISNESTVSEGAFPLVQKRMHLILHENDTIARFLVQAKPEINENDYIAINQSYNGSDTASVFNFDLTTNKMKWETNLQLTGTLFGQSFAIRVRGNFNYWKDIWLNDQLIMRLQGRNLPERIMIKDPAVDPIMMNLLLLLATSPVIDLL
ncbi:MAG: hypothetical protein ACK5B4_07525 [Bacteroidota bacterium]|jgi:hypothetical protein